VTGLKTDITFWAEEYRPIYESHVVSLSDFGDYSKSKNLDLGNNMGKPMGNPMLTHTLTQAVTQPMHPRVSIMGDDG
jgi:hypothetical protein